MSCPATVADPLSGIKSVVSMRKILLLPAPSGPMRPNSSPFSTEKDTSSTALTAPWLYVFVIFFNLTICSCHVRSLLSPAAITGHYQTALRHTCRFLANHRSSHGFSSRTPSARVRPSFEWFLVSTRLYHLSIPPGLHIRGSRRLHRLPVRSPVDSV